MGQFRRVEEVLEARAARPMLGGGVRLFADDGKLHRQHLVESLSTTRA